VGQETTQYSYNHRVEQNADGGESAFRLLQDRSLPVWLKAAGYQTGYYGRYVNRYEGKEVPPGWDECRGKPFVNLGTGVDASHVIGGYGLDGRNAEDETQTQVWADAASSFIGRQTGPSFAYYAPYAPHLPAAYPARYQYSTASNSSVLPAAPVSAFFHCLLACPNEQGQARVWGHAHRTGAAPRSANFTQSGVLGGTRLLIKPSSTSEPSKRHLALL